MPRSRPDRRARVAVLISGRGSNMRALVDAARDPEYPAEIVLVLANRGDAAGLGHAREAGIETLVIDHRDHDGRAAFDTAMDTALRERDIGIVCLAGFMRLLSEAFVAAWRDRILEEEHRCYPLALAWLAAGMVRIDGERTVIAGAPAPTEALRNPDGDPTSQR